MSSDLRDLYQEVIIDHSRRPRNFRKLDAGARSVEGVNPLCGDHVTVYASVEDDRVKELAFQGSGCAISTASASVMTEIVKGKTLAEAQEIFRQFHSLVTEGRAGRHESNLGKLAVFAGVSEFPTRVKCAVLAWHALRSVLEGKNETVSTE